MLGAIAGDVIGSVYESRPIKTVEFPLFSDLSHYTDDTVLTAAVAWVLLEGGDYAAAFKSFGRRYPAGYGASFYRWVHSESTAPYNSWGNGSAMRVSPVGWAFDSAREVLAEAERSAAATHNHPEGIKGAQAAALAVFLARTGADKGTIREEIGRRFGYDLDRSLSDIRPGYRFEISCRKSVPESVIAFLESDDFESAVRGAVSLGGDADTMAAVAGGAAEAYYGRVPDAAAAETRRRLPPEFLDIIDRFHRRYGP